MSTQVSPTTDNVYGLPCVCRICQFACSTLFAQEQRASVPQVPYSQAQSQHPVLRQGSFGDNPCTPGVVGVLGRGIPQGVACLTYGASRSGGRKRVLGLMREHNLLSPHRRSQVLPNEHNGAITTQAPTVMWGVDGTRVFTAKNGYVWIFTAMEHWNGQYMGWHVTKKGDRFAALEPVKQAALHQFGDGGPDMACGLALRMDHGTQYQSDHFQNPLTF